MKSRRRFLMNIFSIGVPVGMLSLIPGSQGRTRRPSQLPTPPKEDDENAPKPDSKLMLEANQKDIKKNVERLYQLASELKAAVEKTDSVQVLSVPLLKKAEEIERLAKAIRSKAIG